MKWILWQQFLLFKINLKQYFCFCILFIFQAFIDVKKVIYPDPPTLSFPLLLSTPSLPKKWSVSSGQLDRLKVTQPEICKIKFQQVFI